MKFFFQSQYFLAIDTLHVCTVPLDFSHKEELFSLYLGPVCDLLAAFERDQLGRRPRNESAQFSLNLHYFNIK